MINIYLLIKNIFNKERNLDMPAVNVLNNLLYIDNKQVEFIENKDVKYSKGKNTCEFIVLHFTGATTAKSAHNQYLNPESKVSWHLTVDRDGKIYQVLGFDKKAWHAGQSSWGNGLITDLNNCSIGIEMANAGKLIENNGQYETWYKQVIPLSDVFFDADGQPWQKFHPKQLETVVDLTLILAKIFKVKDIMSHEMIAPKRKMDCGRAFDTTLKYIRDEYKKNQSFI